MLFCIPKILKNESNSQHCIKWRVILLSCFVSQRYWKMKAIHNNSKNAGKSQNVVLYPKDTEKWKQFTTEIKTSRADLKLFCIPKILKNESNSQHSKTLKFRELSCFVSQRYWKMKAIHNNSGVSFKMLEVVLYPKDTEKWKQFTTRSKAVSLYLLLFCIPKILKNESNSQLEKEDTENENCCFVSQRYWKMKAIHNTWLV
mgnify:CR=1 FL=1